METVPVNAAVIAVSPVTALVFAPLFMGIINRTKAVFAGRKGQPLLQPYYDLLRLFQKGTVYSTSTSWVFRAAPIIIFAATLGAVCFIPFSAAVPALSFTGDLVFMLYLLGLARFFLILSALDTGSAFEGMGASREAFFSALAEPVTFICLINVMRANHTASITAALAVPVFTDSIAVILAAVPLFIVLLAENSRIPFDDPTTHLELTMIHEVMILDNSGPDLALHEYAAALKLWLFALVIGKIISPFSAAHPLAEAAALLIIMAGLAVAVGVTESVLARVRMPKVQQLLFGAGVVSLLGFFISVTGAFTW